MRWKLFNYGERQLLASYEYNEDEGKMCISMTVDYGEFEAKFVINFDEEIEGKCKQAFEELTEEDAISFFESANNGMAERMLQKIIG